MIIENSKTYNLTEVENMFFRPAFCGKAAEELGIRVLYNLPVPTKVPLFAHNSNILKKFAPGWQGGNSSTLTQKEIQMTKLKAESAYSAEDYFSTIYEIIVASSDVNLGDLSGTDLEQAETELFRRALIDSVYANTWFGDTTGTVSDNKNFDGFIARVIKAGEDTSAEIPVFIYDDESEESDAVSILHRTWVNAPEALRTLVADGNLAYFVSSDIYDQYQFHLDSKGVVEVQNMVNGRPVLTYHGIPLIEIPTNGCAMKKAKSFCFLTDRRNLVLALNTADSPEKEIHMWYNPDEMENRQRVVFLAGTTVVDEALLSGTIYNGGIYFTDDYGA